MNEGATPGTVWNYSGNITPSTIDTGKILIGGPLPRDMRMRNRFARLNLDGSLDPNFDPPFGANSTVYAMVLQPDNNLLIGGTFSSVNATRRMGIARLFPDGTVDTTFLDIAHNRFAGLADPAGFITCLAYQADGNVLIGGRFNQLGGGLSSTSMTARYNLAQLIGGSTLDPAMWPSPIPDYSFDEFARAASISISRNNGTLGTVAARYVTVDGLATANLDYAPVIPTSNVAGWASVGSSSQGETNDILVSIALRDDLLVEGNENFKAVFTDLSGRSFWAGIIFPPRLLWDDCPSPIVTIRDNDFSAGALGFSSRFYRQRGWTERDHHCPSDQRSHRGSHRGLCGAQWPCSQRRHQRSGFHRPNRHPLAPAKRAGLSASRSSTTIWLSLTRW